MSKLNSMPYWKTYQRFSFILESPNINHTPFTFKRIIDQPNLYWLLLTCTVCLKPKNCNNSLLYFELVLLSCWLHWFSIYIFFPSHLWLCSRLSHNPITSENELMDFFWFYEWTLVAVTKGVRGYRSLWVVVVCLESIYWDSFFLILINNFAMLLLWQLFVSSQPTHCCLLLTVQLIT
jgi:hypothetical protein